MPQNVVWIGFLGGAYVNDTRTNQTALPGSFLQGTGAPVPVSNLEWLAADKQLLIRPRPLPRSLDVGAVFPPQVPSPDPIIVCLLDERPAALRRHSVSLDVGAVGVVQAAVSAPGIGWLLAERPSLLPRHVVSLDVAAVAPIIAPLVSVTYGWPANNDLPPTRRKRPVYIDGDTAWSVLLPTPPPDVVWLIQETSAPIRVKAVRLDAIVVGNIPPPPPLPDIGWMGQEERAPTRAHIAPQDTSASLVDNAPAPSTDVEWLIQDIVPARVRAARLDEIVSFYLPPPPPLTNVGWLEAAFPPQIYRRGISTWWSVDAPFPSTLIASITPQPDPEMIVHYPPQLKTVSYPSQTKTVYYPSG